MRICYIIASWAGERRGSNYLTGLPLLIKHLDKLNTLKTNINIVYVVDPLKNLSSDLRKIKKYNNLDIRFMQRRDNVGFSYGSWNYCLNKISKKYDYSMLMEDDYCPIIDNFENIFLDYFNKNIGYVCQLYFSHMENGIAAVSNGMINNRIFEKCGFELNNPYGDTYIGAQRAQTYFLDNIKNAGYKIRDISDKYKVKYSDMGKIIEYGNPNGIEVISPII